MYVCSCMQLYVAVCKSVCKSVCMYAFMYVLSYVCMYECIYVRVYVCMFVCLNDCVYVCMYVSVMTTTVSIICTTVHHQMFLHVTVYNYILPYIITQCYIFLTISIRNHKIPRVNVYIAIGCYITTTYYYCARPIVRPTSLNMQQHTAPLPHPHKLLTHVSLEASSGTTQNYLTKTAQKLLRQPAQGKRHFANSASPQEPVCKMIYKWVETFGPVMYVLYIILWLIIGNCVIL